MRISLFLKKNEQTGVFEKGERELVGCLYSLIGDRIEPAQKSFRSTTKQDLRQDELVLRGDDAIKIWRCIRFISGLTHTLYQATIFSRLIHIQ